MEKILDFLNNYFYEFYERNTFTINSTGEITGLEGKYLKGQYIKIKESVLNDGVYKVVDTTTGIKCEGLAEEKFKGVIYSLAVPRQLEETAKKIEEFNSKRAIDGFVSESIPGGYSYTKATVGGVPISWQGAFAMELRPYKKMYSGERYVRRWVK